MIGRTPGEGRYARLEREQRCLLRKVPLGVTNKRVITDHYLTGTRLRLRRVQDDDEVVFKLGQKVRLDTRDPERVAMTNIYLSNDEYLRFTALASSEISKIRGDYEVEGVTYAIDQFSGRHSGVLLAEAEIGDGDSRWATPDFAVSEVTRDNRYSGGWLANATESEIRELLE